MRAPGRLGPPCLPLYKLASCGGSNQRVLLSSRGLPGGARQACRATMQPWLCDGACSLPGLPATMPLVGATCEAEGAPLLLALGPCSSNPSYACQDAAPFVTAHFKHVAMRQ